MAAIRRLILLLTLIALMAGCNREPEPPDTGSRAAVKSFYEALCHQDWPVAYALLHPDSKSKWSEGEFTRLGEQYRRGFGFEPSTVHVRSCEEHGAEAVAQLVLATPGDTGQRTSKEAAVLRMGPDGWGVVLPPTFGSKARR
jgi:hypothetical protein